MPAVHKQSATNSRPALAKSSNAWEQIEGIKMLLYGESGSGKTRLWSTFPAPILALICSGGSRPGELRSIDTPQNRKRIKAVIINSTDDFRRELNRLQDFSTLVVDHSSGYQDLICREILGIDELPATRSWGMMTQAQWGQSNRMCIDAFRQLLSTDKHVVIVAQERTSAPEDPNGILPTRVGPALTPGLTGWLRPACDYVCQTFKRGRTRQETTEIPGGEPLITEVPINGVDYCLRIGPHFIYDTKFRESASIMQDQIRKDSLTPEEAGELLQIAASMPDIIVSPTFTKIQALIKRTTAV
jgi:hypothetical protein